MGLSRDQSAFVSRLFEEHSGAVRHYLCRLTNDLTTAEDLSQEVYLRVLRSAHTYESRGRERAWIFRIARNVFLDYNRERIRRPSVSPDLDVAAVAPVQGIRVDLRSALNTLTPDDRDAFLLCELGGLTYQEIATILGLSMPSVRSRIYRARLTLRAVLLPVSPNVRATGNDDDDD